jgi:hypothetical protein
MSWVKVWQGLFVMYQGTAAATSSGSSSSTMPDSNFNSNLSEETMHCYSVTRRRI